MKLSEIKNGAIIETRNGNRFIKIDNTFLAKAGSYIGVDSYNEEMLCVKEISDEWDIIRVNNNVADNDGYLSNAVYQSYYIDEWTWEREKLELTKEEKDLLQTICNHYDVKYIVKNACKSGEWLNIFICNPWGDIKINDVRFNIETIKLPYFEHGTEYISMKLNREYTPTELGLKDE